MSKCVKTGCDVFIEEYRGTVRCDLHVIDDGNEPIVVIKFNPHSWNYETSNIDCKVFIGSGYFEEYSGILVVPLSNCEISKYFQR